MFSNRLPVDSSTVASLDSILNSLKWDDFGVALGKKILSISSLAIEITACKGVDGLEAILHVTGSSNRSDVMQLTLNFSHRICRGETYQTCNYISTPRIEEQKYSAVSVNKATAGDIFLLWL